MDLDERDTFALENAWSTLPVFSIESTILRITVDCTSSSSPVIISSGWP